MMLQRPAKHHTITGIRDPAHITNLRRTMKPIFNSNTWEPRRHGNRNICTRSNKFQSSCVKHAQKWSPSIPPLIVPFLLLITFTTSQIDTTLKFISLTGSLSPPAGSHSHKRKRKAKKMQSKANTKPPHANLVDRVFPVQPSTTHNIHSSHSCVSLFQQASKQGQIAFTLPTRIHPLNVSSDATPTQHTAEDGLHSNADATEC